MTEPLEQTPPARDPIRLRRRIDQGSQGPRRGAQAAGHVYRRHRRRLGPAPHGLRGRRQRHRRGAGRPRHRRRRSTLNRRRLVHGARQRPRHPDRHPQGRRRLGGRGHHDPAARRRKVRPELLQGLRRPARRRRLGRQRAVELAASCTIWRDGKEHFMEFTPWRRGRAAQGRRRRRTASAAPR